MKKSGQYLLTNTSALSEVSLRGTEEIPSLCSERAVQSRLYRMRLPRFLRPLTMTIRVIYCVRTS